ncbi:MAG: hypothetical protein AAGD11_14025 [Planctomycetota bacterium]
MNSLLTKVADRRIGAIAGETVRRQNSDLAAMRRDVLVLAGSSKASTNHTLS